jgi:hypothetical protein
LPSMQPSLGSSGIWPVDPQQPSQARLPFSPSGTLSPLLFEPGRPQAMGRWAWRSNRPLGYPCWRRHPGPEVSRRNRTSISFPVTAPSSSSYRNAPLLCFPSPGALLSVGAMGASRRAEPQPVPRIAGLPGPHSTRAPKPLPPEASPLATCPSDGCTPRGHTARTPRIVAVQQ